MAWSADGCTLVVSSTDGFCSIASFEKGELGVPIVEDVSATEKGEAKNESEDNMEGVVIGGMVGGVCEEKVDVEEKVEVNKHPREDLPVQTRAQPVVKKRRIVPTFLGK